MHSAHLGRAEVNRAAPAPNEHRGSVDQSPAAASLLQRWARRYETLERCVAVPTQASRVKRGSGALAIARPLQSRELP